MKIDKQLILRIALSPFIFIWGAFMLFAGSLFPLPLLVIFSAAGFIGTPFVWLLKQSGSDIEYMGPFLGGNEESGKMIIWYHFLGMTIYFWGAFAVTYDYIKTGDIFTGD